MKIEQERPDKMLAGKAPVQGKKLQLACIVLGLLILFLGVKSYMGMRTLQGTIAKQETELAALEKEIDARGGPRSEEQKAGDNAPGADEKEDTPELAFLKKLLTWDSHESYSQVRNWLKNDYNVGKKEQLLASFMPNIKEEDFGGANMAFKEADIYLLSQDGDTSQYFALCKVTNRIDGNTGVGKTGVFFSMDKENHISSISAYALAR